MKKHKMYLEYLKEKDRKARERLENYINTFLSIDDSRDILRVAHEEQDESVILVIYDMCGNEKDRINVTANSKQHTCNHNRVLSLHGKRSRVLWTVS